MQDSPQGPQLGEDAYLQVRKGAVLLVSKHTPVCCEVLDAQLVGKQGRRLRRLGQTRTGHRHLPCAYYTGPAKSHLESDLVWSKEQARVSVGVGFGMGMEGSFWSLAPSRQGESEEIWKAVMGFRGNLRAADLW